MVWIKSGLAFSLGLAALFALRGRWPAARFAARLAAGFLEKWSELRLAARVRAHLEQVEAAGRAGRSP